MVYKTHTGAQQLSEEPSGVRRLCWPCRACQPEQHTHTHAPEKQFTLTLEEVTNTHTYGATVASRRYESRARDDLKQPEAASRPGNIKHHDLLLPWRASICATHWRKTCAVSGSCAAWLADLQNAPTTLLPPAEPNCYWGTLSTLVHRVYTMCTEELVPILILVDSSFKIRTR